MLRLKEVCALLDKKHIEYDRDGQYIRIFSCALGDNFYDYGEEPKKIKIDDKEVRQVISNDPRVKIFDCSDCGGCGGW